VGIAERLSGGDPRSLGQVDQVVGCALGDSDRLHELFCCLFADDPIVRMRAADGLEKVARRQPALLVPYVDRLLAEVSAIEQPSVQWHLAQILGEVPLTAGQRRRAVEILKRNVEHSDDWIVLNLTMESLAGFAQDDVELRRWLLPVLRRRLADRRKAVAKRAGRLLEQLQQ